MSALGQSGGGISRLAFRRAMTLEKLRRAAMTASSPDAAALSPATVTAAAGSAFDAALTNIYGQTGDRLLNALRFTGGNVLPNGLGYRLEVASAGVSNGNLGGGKSAWTGEMAMVVDNATKVQIGLNGAATSFYRVMVNGLWISQTPQAYAAQTDNVLTIDLSPLPAGGHELLLEINNGVRPREVRIGPAGTLSRPTRRADRITVLVTGDSYSEHVGTSFNQLVGYTKILGRLMGWTDVRQVALGGTGYTNPGGAAGSTFTLPQQVLTWPVINADLAVGGIMRSVDVVVIASGYNDADPTSDTSSAAYKAFFDACTLTYRRARTVCPNALIVVLGPWSGTRGTNNARSLATEAAVKAAFMAWGDPFSAFAPVSAAVPQPWLTGTGRVGATTGAGNTDVYISSDGVHPSDAGHAYLARMIAAALRAILRL